MSPPPAVPMPPAPEEKLTPIPNPLDAPKATWAKPQPLEPTPAPQPPSAILPVSATTRTDVAPGEPPLAAVAGPLQVYEVRAEETVQEIARRTLGNGERWSEIQKLNPTLKSGEPLVKGTLVRLPADAAVSPTDEIDAIKPLPAMRPKSAPDAPKKILPLTGTFPCTLDDKHVLTLPKGLRDQLGNCDTILVSPGPDQCLWITNHAHIERLAERLELSPAKEMDVRVFKRLYYAQTEKAVLTNEGKMSISDKLVQFAGLRQDVVLVGIDEHFELWDAAKWRTYTQQKSAEARSAMTEHE
jgi:MraZ protein